MKHTTERGTLRDADKLLMLLCLGACVFGLILISSATRSYGEVHIYLVKQMVAILLGLIGMLLIMFIGYDWLCKHFYLVLIACILFLAATLIWGVGGEETGNQSWLRFGLFGIQPSEFVKVGFILTYATHLYLCGENINRFANVLLLIAHVVLIFVLVALQKDMGNALVFAFICLIMTLFSSLKLRYYLFAAFVLLLSSPLIWFYGLRQDQRMRILVIFDPTLDPNGAGWHALQSKGAIAMGGFTGMGLGRGRYTQSDLLPAKHTDFIFSTCAEELGAIGCFLLILLLLAILYRVFYRGYRAADDLGSYLCIGVFALLFCQIVENIGMCFGVLPVIGITLPFISYGGSSVMSLFFAVGLVQSVAMKQRALGV